MTTAFDPVFATIITTMFLGSLGVGALITTIRHRTNNVLYFVAGSIAVVCLAITFLISFTHQPASIALQGHWVKTSDSDKQAILVLLGLGSSILCLVDAILGLDTFWYPDGPFQNDVAIGYGLGPRRLAHFANIKGYLEGAFPEAYHDEWSTSMATSLLIIKRSIIASNPHTSNIKRAWYAVLTEFDHDIKKISERLRLLRNHRDALKAGGKLPIAYEAIVASLDELKEKLNEKQKTAQTVHAASLPTGVFDRIINATESKTQTEPTLTLAPELQSIIQTINDDIDTILSHETQTTDERVFRAKETRERYIPDTLAAYAALRTQLERIQVGMAQNRASFEVATNPLESADLAMKSNGQFLNAVFAETVTSQMPT